MPTSLEGCVAAIDCIVADDLMIEQYGDPVLVAVATYLRGLIAKGAN